jgi:predicted tellurium resistance membrane protein TerC
VFIGILAMRFVAQYFVRLLERYPYLEYSAFVVIALLGLKLLVPAIVHFLGHHELAKAMESEHVDQWFSLITAGFFFVPMLSSRLFGFPQRGV